MFSFEVRETTREKRKPGLKRRQRGSHFSPVPDDKFGNLYSSDLGKVIFCI